VPGYNSTQVSHAQYGFVGSILLDHLSHTRPPWNMLEFEVASKGQLLASAEAVRNWLPGAFESVVSRRQAEAAGGHTTTVQ
jgi:hypothetical protein